MTYTPNSISAQYFSVRKFSRAFAVGALSVSLLLNYFFSQAAMANSREALSGSQELSDESSDPSWLTDPLPTDPEALELRRQQLEAHIETLQLSQLREQLRYKRLILANAEESLLIHQDILSRLQILVHEGAVSERQYLQQIEEVDNQRLTILRFRASVAHLSSQVAQLEQATAVGE